MKNLYEITHYTKSNKTEQKYIIHIEAITEKEAMAMVKEWWYGAFKKHMFRVNARKVPLTEIIDMKHWFTQVG